MNELTAYALDFVSYLILQENKIDKIILFGSAARGDYNKDSDIDIFIHSQDFKGLKEKIGKIEKAFLSSGRINKWKRMGIKNEFSFIAGDINQKKWVELKESMLQHAYVLFDRFTESEKYLKPYALIKWHLDSKDAKKRVKLSRKLYGYSMKDKRYKGILEELPATKIGNATVIIAMERIQVLRKIFSELKIKYSVYPIYMK